VWPYSGKFTEAREIAAREVEMTMRLPPHHRLHAAASVILLETMAGNWPAVTEYSGRAETAFADNVATPCILGPVMLLSCALGWVQLGNEQEAQRLEQVVRDFGMEGYGRLLGPAEVALAEARGDKATLQRSLRDFRPTGLDEVEALAAWLDALITLDRKAEIEERAPALAIPGSYLEPFALRALGYARQDHALIEGAATRFREMGLDWHADRTSRFLSRGRE
jgi:hypothetical protein